jgi:hypothetical protein
VAGPGVKGKTRMGDAFDRPEVCRHGWGRSVASFRERRLPLFAKVRCRMRRWARTLQQAGGFDTAVFGRIVAILPLESSTTVLAHHVLLR